jgi:hypothetical protein
MFDVLPPTDAPSLAIAPTPSPRDRGMQEPGIFKGCTDGDGPLAPATKDAILAYLGKPNAAAWDRLRTRAIAGRTTLGEAWALAAPGGHRRFPTSAELIRTMRVAVVAQWAGSAKLTLRTH